MLKRNAKTDQNAQTIIEYSIVLSLVVVIIFSMTPVVKRSTQGMIKFVADLVGVQQNGDQLFGANTGELEESYIATRTRLDTVRRELVGTINYVYGDVTLTSSNALINLGFTETEN